MDARQAVQELSREFGEHLVVDLSLGAKHIIRFAPEDGRISLHLLGWREGEERPVERRWLRWLTRAPLYPAVLSLSGVRAFAIDDTVRMEHCVIENFVYCSKSTSILVIADIGLLIRIYLHSPVTDYSVVYQQTSCGWFYSDERALFGIPLIFGQSWWIVYNQASNEA